MHYLRLPLFAGLLLLAACSGKQNEAAATTDPNANPASTPGATSAAPTPAAAANEPGTAPAATAPVNAEAYGFTLSGGPFNNQRVTVAHPTDAATRPGAAIGFWSAQSEMGTVLDASHEKPNGVILRLPSANADKPGTYPIASGAIMNNGEGSIGDVSITGGSVTISQYGGRLVGTFEAQGTYMDMANGMKQVPVTISNGTFDLGRGSNR
ncbi:hypothetical protein [Solirubrum puertoriconensis]|uniref:Transferrin-binding protein B C-lobe/N-lobe beta barrel domain-containing protein n=1 Tax=Solirubrum puertoriconensis TaxID=1751427 RepID=A0A9X0HPM1_SOLP1|nr:hypothetical protein [Solirubrum puertoriconensis]KUG09942.1 hypothetical protein ASU33_20560 [Solirubrum puertoriconensis]